MFAGALRYPLSLVRPHHDSIYYAYDGGETDTSKEVEYTGQQVDRFAREFSQIQYESDKNAGLASFAEKPRLKSFCN